MRAGPDLAQRAVCAVASVALVLAAPVRRAAAQGVGLEVGHLFEGSDWTEYHAGLEYEVAGPLGAELYGTYLRAGEPGTERLWGAGLDFTLFRAGRQGLYSVAGVSGGYASGAAKHLWGSWSAGIGLQVLPAGPFGIGAEARWRKLSPGSRSGVELSFRLGVGLGRPGRPAATDAARPIAVAPSPLPPPAPADAAPSEGPQASAAPAVLPSSMPSAITDPRTLADSVVATAAEAMGTAYRLGGTGADGFDCSGLIQYAYGRHGVALPRTSAEQAHAGRKVRRGLDELRPGDILTFSTTGRGVTHVGLYVGDGQFVHSASRGVQLSRLDDADPYGRWWYRRWIGVRRVVE
ncbi:MAG TPA: C40 family peptidase [Gemmatimonadales bacterium]|nr:C40 family peptidase [Gemmatimonadales bacterium]